MPKKKPPRAKPKNPPRFSSVEDYIAKQDPVKGKTLKTVIDFILKQFPELESKIAWNVPTVHRNGKYVAGIDAFKNHLTFSAFSGRVIEHFKDRLSPYVRMKYCFQIPIDWNIDKTLVTDLVRARLAEIDAGQ